MKCPDCEKQPIVDCETCHPCPKCGSEMEQHITGWGADDERYFWWCPVCKMNPDERGHSKKAKL